MKKLMTALLFIIAAVMLCSCSPAKKPLQPPARTYIVPEVTRVDFTAVELASAPKVVRDVAKTQENRDSTTWAQAGGNAYLIVSQGEKTGGYDVKIADVLQHLPQEGFSWLDVRVDYSKSSQPKNGSNPLFTVVKAGVNSTPGGVGFSITGLDTNGASGTQSVSPSAPSAPPVKTESQAGAAIDKPSPNQEITSPVRIEGKAGGPGQKRVRISTRGGQIIKEENLQPSAGGAFSIVVSYSSPELPIPGEISVLSVSGQEETVMARVAVIIK